VLLPHGNTLPLFDGFDARVWNTGGLLRANPPLRQLGNVDG
jgi:hypothetical protein